MYAMASDKGLDRPIRKVEKTSLQKFKNQNRVVKKFGSTGLKVYRAIRKTGITVSELMEKTGLEQVKLAEILAFLEEKAMIEPAEGEAPPEVEEETELAEPEGPIEEEPLKKGKKKEEEAAQEKEIAPEEEKPAEEERAPEEELPKKKPAIEEEVAPPEELAKKKKKLGVEEEIAPLEEEEKAPGEKAIAPEGEIVPEEEELPKEEEEAAKEKPPEEEEKPPAEEEEKEEAPKEEEDVIPLEMEEEKPAEEEKEIEAHEEEEEKPEEEAPEGEEAFLTPGEKKIKEKYGQQGLDIYNLIDGQRTAEEIMKQTGVTEAKLIEMLDFMEKEGIIKLEHPGGKKPVTPPPRAPAAHEEGGFAPMIEGTVSPGVAPGVQAAEGPEFVLDVPAKFAGNLIKEIQLKAALLIKYRQPGVKVLELIDGMRDAVELSLVSGVPLYTVYEILAILKKEGMIAFKPATRDDIRKKYGEDGYSVYKRYGREGVMLYQLIGKNMDLREMAAKTSKDNKRVVEIFMFIHKLLGIDLPIDEEVLLQRLSTPIPPKK